MTSYWCELAWLGHEAEAGVVIGVDGDHIASIDRGVDPAPADAVRLRGLTLPGLANGHSHAFHRALRGRTQAGAGSFWTWREQMYTLAERLTPDTYYRLARATYAEMTMAGVVAVGEFHYVHHQADGTAFDDPNAMGEALLAAASDVGIRITLLDTLYLYGGLGADGYVEAGPEQRRFSDGDVEAWADRIARLEAGPRVAIGAAVHSVRAVDPASMARLGEWARAAGAPVHIHLSEQPSENEQCRAVHGCSPVELAAASGLLTANTTAIHATHVSPADIALIGSSGTGVCLCPTTERDLADGVGPAAELAGAGATLSLGSDSHAVIDLFEEARAVELDERLVTNVRGHHTPAELLAMATRGGRLALGCPDGGVLAEGAPADMVTIGLESVRLAGVDAASVVAGTVFAAGAADVHHVVVGGEVVVRDGAHTSIDAAGELSSAIAELVAS